MTSTHGQLNPDWVEWLMGWPVGWTDVGAEADAMRWPGFEAAELPEGDGRIPRTTSERKNRVARIKALGNGQVPLCAAIGFEMGIGILERMMAEKEAIDAARGHRGGWAKDGGFSILAADRRREQTQQERADNDREQRNEAQPDAVEGYEL